VRERLGGQPLPLLQGEPAGGHGGEHVVVRLGRGDDGDRRVVLGRRPHHRRSADVDLLDALVDARSGRDGLAERVEVGDHEVEGLDAELLELPDVGGQPPVGEDARVHLRVQRLDAAVEALREARQVLDLRDRDAEGLDAGGRAAGGDQRDARVAQGEDEVVEAGLVVDGDERAADGDLAHGWLLRGSAEAGTQAVDAHDVTPRWSPTLASRVRPA
jgi:hypothetical protein